MKRGFREMIRLFRKKHHESVECLVCYAIERGLNPEQIEIVQYFDVSNAENKLVTGIRKKQKNETFS